jgi:hypothetical protein
MPQVGFKLMIAAFELAKTVHALTTRPLRSAEPSIAESKLQRLFVELEIAFEPLQIYSAMPKLAGRKDYIAFYNFIKFLRKLKPLLSKSVHETALYDYVDVE